MITTQFYYLLPVMNINDLIYRSIREACGAGREKSLEGVSTCVNGHGDITLLTKIKEIIPGEARQSLKRARLRHWHASAKMNQPKGLQAKRASNLISCLGRCRKTVISVIKGVPEAREHLDTHRRHGHPGPAKRSYCIWGAGHQCLLGTSGTSR